MWPTLVSIGPVAIHSFGVMLFLGIFFGGFIFWQKGKEEGVDEAGLMDGWLISGLISFVAARAWQVLANWEEYNHWYKIIFITKFPGLAYEGALLGFWLALVFWIIKKQWQFWQILEAAVFSQLVVEMFGRIGQFLAKGRWQLPWEIFWFFGLAVIYRLLGYWNKKYRSFGWYKGKLNEAKAGFLVVVYLLGTGGLQLGLAGGNRWLGAGLVLLGLVLLIERSGRGQKIKLPSRPKTTRKKLGFDFK